jgi:hypothetical protein
MTHVTLEADFTPRESLCRANKTDRHKRCARHKRHARGTPVPYPVAADGALREDHHCLFSIKRLPYLCEREMVTTATLNPIALSPSSSQPSSRDRQSSAFATKRSSREIAAPRTIPSRNES